MIYLDHNATTYMLEDVKTHLLNFTNSPQNPSSIHSSGRNSRKLLEESRASIAEALGIKLGRGEYKIIFTSGATEANNLILENFNNTHVIYSSIEHPSIIEKAKNNKLSQSLSVNIDGTVNLEELEDKLQKLPTGTLVTVMAANNETGVIQPIEKISYITKKYGAFLHVDAVQLFGKSKLNLAELNVDFISITSHKIGGLPGIGALISRDEFQIKPVMIGGGQERSERSGTENVMGASCFAIASKLVQQNIKKYYDHTSSLRDRVENHISSFKNVHIIGKNAPRLPNTSLIAMESVSSNVQLIQFDSDGIAVSNGSACSSGKVKESHVLASMGYEKNITNCVIRISFGRDNTQEDAASFIKCWEKIYNKFN